MPDDPTLDPVGRLVRELIGRERLANTVAADTAESLDELFQQIAEALTKIDPTAVARLRYRRSRTDKVLREIQTILRKYRPELEMRLRGHLAEIGRAEALRAQGTLVATLGQVGEQAVRKTPITQARLRAILTTDPFRGKTLREHTARLAANVYDRTLAEIRLGMVREESIQDIVRRVRGRQAGFIRQDAQGRFVARGTRAARVRPRFVGGVLSTSTRDAEALVRTAVNHVSNVGMMETYRANEDVVEGVRVVATLDDRTTEICISLDGTVWALDDPGLRLPPYHFQCRTITVAEIAWARLGLEPPPDFERFARDLSGVSGDDLARRVSARRRTGGFGPATRVSSSTVATEWLRRQRFEVQAKMLGTGKARLFRAGKITLRDIVRDDFTIVPLSELASVN